MKIRLLSLAVALMLCLSLLPMTALAAEPAAPPAATDNAVTLYADYGDGFEFLSSLYFEDGVTEQTVTVERPITALRVVKGVCYELNLDRLTLNGACPAGYERKLSATDFFVFRSMSACAASCVASSPRSARALRCISAAILPRSAPPSEASGTCRGFAIAA